MFFAVGESEDRRPSMGFRSVSERGHVEEAAGSRDKVVQQARARERGAGSVGGTGATMRPQLLSGWCGYSVVRLANGWLSQKQ